MDLVKGAVNTLALGQPAPLAVSTPEASALVLEFSANEIAPEPKLIRNQHQRPNLLLRPAEGIVVEGQPAIRFTSGYVAQDLDNLTFNNA